MRISYGCGVAASVLLAGCATSVAHYQPTSDGGVCTAWHRGVEYRTYLPGDQRYVFLSVTAVSGPTPSVYVIADKNYRGDDGSKAETAWWLDRSKPVTFSGDRISARWDDGEASVSLHGEPVGNAFDVRSIKDPNRYAFQTELKLKGFSGDSFEVTLPALTIDGVTVAPPPVHFSRTDARATKC